MSFVRASRSHPTQSKRKKPVAKRKPLPWDDTLNDLTAYQATPDEIAYRKASHQSKFAIVSRLNRLPGSAKKGKRPSPYKSNAQAHKLAIMKEVLYDQHQLQDALEKSDTMMSMVKDLFGDDPRRFAGFPAVTSAPNQDKQAVSTSLIKQHPDIQTHSEFLSDSVMDGSALNDLQTDSDEDENASAAVRYQPKMNMERFQQFLEAEEKNNTLSTISGQAGMSHLGQGTFSQMGRGAVHSSQLPDQTGALSQDGTFQTPKKGLDESIAILRPPKSAINATDKVKKTKPRVPQPERNTSSYSLPDLKKVLETLEAEIDDYEQQTGRRMPAERPRNDTFSGYTLAIVDSVTKLTRYLRECELRLKAEITVREQLAQDVVQYKALVDALTSDIITTQEEFGMMSSEFQKFRSETRTELQNLKGLAKLPETQVYPTAIAESPEQPYLVAPSAPNIARSEEDNQLLSTTTPPRGLAQQTSLPVTEANLPREINPFGDHLKPISAAVLLSPPVRRSRVTEPEREVDAARRQAGLLNMHEYLSSEDTNNSALQDDYVALPRTSHTGQSLPQPVSYPGPSMEQRSAPNALSLAGDGPVPSTKQVRLPTATLNTVNVPRPAPLVQTNTAIPISSVTSKPSQPLVLRESAYSSLPNDQSNVRKMPHDHAGVSSMLPSSDRDFLASQIAELNKQHAEAQKRLNGLMLGQQAPVIQTNTSDGQGSLMPSASQQQQQQNCIPQQQPASPPQPLQQQRQLLPQQQHLQKDQQEKLAEMVLQQQQRMFDQQQRLQQQAKMLQQQDHYGMKQRLTSQFPEGQSQQQVPPQQQQRGRLPQPNIPAEMRQSAEIPGYRPAKQTGLPACPVSPNISPISQRSENFRLMRQSADSENTSLMVPAGRGITVSIPKVDMDLSPSSPSPNPEIAR